MSPTTAYVVAPLSRLTIDFLARCMVPLFGHARSCFSHTRTHLPVSRWCCCCSVSRRPTRVARIVGRARITTTLSHFGDFFFFFCSYYVTIIVVRRVLINKRPRSFDFLRIERREVYYVRFLFFEDCDKRLFAAAGGGGGFFLQNDSR